MWVAGFAFEGFGPDGLERYSGIVARMGPATTTSSEAQTDQVGAVLRILPNPAAGSSRVALTLAAPAEAAVRVVDALGRTVATRSDRALPAGTTTLAVDASRLAPGVYAVVAETGAGRTVARFSVVR